MWMSLMCSARIQFAPGGSTRTAIVRSRNAFTSYRPAYARQPAPRPVSAPAVAPTAFAVLRARDDMRQRYKGLTATLGTWPTLRQAQDSALPRVRNTRLRWAQDATHRQAQKMIIQRRSSSGSAPI